MTNYTLEVPPLTNYDDFEAFFSPSRELNAHNEHLALICIATAYPLLSGFKANSCRTMQTWAEIVTEKELNHKNPNFLSAFYVYDKMTEGGVELNSEA